MKPSDCSVAVSAAGGAAGSVGRQWFGQLKYITTRFSRAHVANAARCGVSVSDCTF
jgi:hypothetical protein